MNNMEYTVLVPYRQGNAIIEKEVLRKSLIEGGQEISEINQFGIVIKLKQATNPLIMEKLEPQYSLPFAPIKMAAPNILPRQRNFIVFTLHIEGYNNIFLKKVNDWVGQSLFEIDCNFPKEYRCTNILDIKFKVDRKSESLVCVLIQAEEIIN